MAAPYTPQNVNAEQADANILITWQGALGASGYTVQRSTDGVNFTNLATVGLTTSYLDALPGIGTTFYYQVLATNTDGSSSPSSITQMVAAPPSEMSLFELRLRSQQTADRVGSEFVTTTEWNAFLRLAMYELYDLLITSYEDYFALSVVTIPTDGTTQNYLLPNGATNYLGGVFNGTSGNPAPAFYKLSGVDLNVNTSNLTPSRVTLLRFDFIKRNTYVYPNSTSTIYGVYNMRYRIMDDKLAMIPTPSGGQTLVMWYTPRLPALLQDTDLTTLGTSGWLRYVIVRAAKYALDKEEGSDTSKLDTEIAFLKQRIEQAAQNRDTGQAETISETRVDPVYGGTGWGGGTATGGWAWLFPIIFPYYVGNDLLANSELLRYAHLASLLGCVSITYLLYLYMCKLRSRICLSREASAPSPLSLSFCTVTQNTSFIGRVLRIVFGGSKK